MAPNDGSDVVFERYFYVGNLLQAVCFGVILYLAFDSIMLLRRPPPSTIVTFNGVPTPIRTQDRTAKMRRFLIVYVLALVFCMCFALSSNQVLGQRMWIDDRGFPGGPSTYWEVDASNWVNVTGSALCMWGNFMGDLLLLYRAYIIWDSHKWVVAPPTLLFLASTTMAVIACVQSALPGSSPFVRNSLPFYIPWVALTSSLNIYLTVLITYRLIAARLQVRRYATFHSDDMYRIYTGPVAIFVESALPFSLLGAIFAVLLGIDNSAYLLFNAVWGSYVAFAPLLIIHRMANGKAWQKDTAQQMSTLHQELFSTTSSRTRTVTQVGLDRIDFHSDTNSTCVV